MNRAMAVTLGRVYIYIYIYIYIKHLFKCLGQGKENYQQHK